MRDCGSLNLGIVAWVAKQHHIGRLLADHRHHRQGLLRSETFKLHGYAQRWC